MLGGWSAGDITDERVQACTTYAFEQAQSLNDQKYEFLQNINISECTPRLVNVEQQVNTKTHFMELVEIIILSKNEN